MKLGRLEVKLQPDQPGLHYWAYSNFDLGERRWWWSYRLPSQRRVWIFWSIK